MNGIRARVRSLQLGDLKQMILCTSEEWNDLAIDRSGRRLTTTSLDSNEGSPMLARIMGDGEGVC